MTKSKETKKKTNKKSKTCCQGCNMEVNEDVKALNCDKCGGQNAWKYIDCLHNPEDVYDSFSSDIALQWFCDICRDQVMSDKNPI